VNRTHAKQLRSSGVRTNAEEVIMAMKRFLVTYLAPASVIEAWKKTPAESRKAAEANMQNLWKSWMSNHHNIFVDKGAGVGKTRRVTAQAAPMAKTIFCCIQSWRRRRMKPQQRCSKIIRI
jgi:hypothetical protein